ncbi:MAG: SDR family NAD(P)-dependent oxidoreductase, partial [Burkholderiaceae bacterium]|nr:SDR family NAD(P)-dependent oxidoreductase [Burkholderiaceae bacterium]
MRLKDKVALVTGGGSGFGAGICSKFVAEGAKVLVVDRNLEGAQRVAAGLGPNAAAYAADVSRKQDTLAMIDA